MPDRLQRLLHPKSVAIVGGGAWCENVVAQCLKLGFEGPIWPVHPNRAEIAGVAARASVWDLPAAPDAVFVGVNRETTVRVVADLAKMGAGGAVCFASGFAEAEAELAGSSGLQDHLLEAAGEMPILGPNCYGFINYLDRALLWPDQHGGLPCDRGVAILAQSSNIAINLTMQTRGLPVAYIVTVGNQAQFGMAAIALHLLKDPRVSAIGLHIEGFQDIRAFESLAEAARRLGKRVVALKVGRSEQARQATVSHTASVAGSAAGATALLARLGFLSVSSIPVFVETLKLLHVTGGLTSAAVSALSCSGGEASLIADAGHAIGVRFPALSHNQKSTLRASLGPKVALANPLDYHTYIWNDVPAMAAVFGAMMVPEVGVTVIIVDFPRSDRCDPTDWGSVIESARHAKRNKGGHIALLSTLPETLPEQVAQQLIAYGIVPMCGLDDALAAIRAASAPVGAPQLPVVLPGSAGSDVIVIPEAEAKNALAAHGMRVPKSRRARSAKEAAAAADALGGAVVLKGEGLAHKTEAGAVALNLTSPQEVLTRANHMASQSFLIEEMVENAVAELLIGVVADPAHGFVLTLAAGGVLTEVLRDRQNMLLPVSDADLDLALSSLKLSRVLKGYRGAPPADLGAIKAAVRAIEAYVIDTADTSIEVEVNPLICTSDDAIAVDALIRKGDQDD
ncbi:MAG: acetate--CoA ligase family protein [Rhodobacteraceae bacterium]|nr:acetate--CoA ligase family protein [Paracoccaceae bacterium]